MPRCSFCHRKLTDQVSIAAGAGPSCRVKNGISVVKAVKPIKATSTIWKSRGRKVNVPAEQFALPFEEDTTASQ